MKCSSARSSNSTRRARSPHKRAHSGGRRGRAARRAAGRFRLLLRSRQFALYFAGNALSASGTWFQNLAAAILVFRLTGLELLLGVLTFSYFAPTLLLAPWAGAVADRFDRRRVLILFELIAAALAATLAVITALGLESTALVILFGLGLGVTSAFAPCPRSRRSSSRSFRGRRSRPRSRSTR